MQVKKEHSLDEFLAVDVKEVKIDVAILTQKTKDGKMWQAYFPVLALSSEAADEQEAVFQLMEKVEDKCGGIGQKLTMLAQLRDMAEMEMMDEMDCDFSAE